MSWEGNEAGFDQTIEAETGEREALGGEQPARDDAQGEAAAPDQSTAADDARKLSDHAEAVRSRRRRAAKKAEPEKEQSAVPPEPMRWGIPLTALEAIAENMRPLAAMLTLLVDAVTSGAVDLEAETKGRPSVETQLSIALAGVAIKRNLVEDSPESALAGALVGGVVMPCAAIILAKRRASNAKEAA